MHIGSRLKQILEERGMTVTQLSRDSGISAQTLYATINRDSNKVDLDIMAKMLVALDMDFMEFLGQERKAPAEKIPAEPQPRRRDLESYLL